MADNISTLARPYASAAFKQAQEEGRLSDWSEMLAQLSVIVKDPTVTGLIANPNVNNAELGAMVTDVAGDALKDTGKNFARVLAENGRLDLTEEIAIQFEAMRAEQEGRSQVHVQSAFALDDKQRQEITKSMSKRLGRDVELSVEVDETLIGGAIIRAGDLVIDGSLRGRLRALVQQLV